MEISFSANTAGGFRPSVESDLALGRNGSLQHLPESRKNGVEFGIVALFHVVDFAAQILMCGYHGAQLDEGAHNRDIHLHGAAAAEHAGEHRYALLSEYEWGVTPPAPRVL